jgi:hypothetical protein
MCDRICRNCKHWGGKYGNFDVNNYNFNDAFWTTEKRIEYIIENRKTTDYKMECMEILNVIEIDIDQGSGWDAGGASVESVNTPPTFSCSRFEEATYK